MLRVWEEVWGSGGEAWKSVLGCGEVRRGVGKCVGVCGERCAGGVEEYGIAGNNTWNKCVGV